MDKITELRQERDRLAARLAVVDKAIEAYDAWESAASAALGQDGVTNTALSAAATVAPAEPRTPPKPRPPSEPGTPMAEFTQEVESVLRRADRPLNRSDLLAALKGRGVVVGGADPRNTLSARMSRLQNATNLPGYGYWLAERPYPPAGYLTEPDVVQGSIFEPDAT